MPCAFRHSRFSWLLALFLVSCVLDRHILKNCAFADTGTRVQSCTQERTVKLAKIQASKRHRESSGARIPVRDQKNEEIKKYIKEEIVKKEREGKGKKNLRAGRNKLKKKKNRNEPPSISVKCRRRVSLFLVDLLSRTILVNFTSRS